MRLQKGCPRYAPPIWHPIQFQQWHNGPLNYQRSVFINCPFDDDYVPLLRALIFAVVDCGFVPRCALEASDASEIRIQRIYRVISECALGIHDLSRTQLDARTGLPRFNMPLELGIFLGAKFLGQNEQREKGCLVFDEHPYHYRMYLSDVAGQDINWHGNNPKNVICRVRDWLAAMVREHLPSGSIVWDHYGTFQGELRQTCTRLKQKPQELTYNDLLRHVTAFRSNYSEALDIRGTRTISNPSAEDIKEAIRSIGKAIPDPYVILQKGASGYTYIQAILAGKSLWQVEYQDGHLDQHFAAANSIGTEDLIRMFVSYAHADDAWRSAVEWDLVEL